MLQTFFVVLAIIMTLSISSINNLWKIYLEKIALFKTIENIEYWDFKNLELWKVTHCERKRKDNLTMLSWYCFYKKDIFIPDWKTRNLNIDIIVKEDWIKQKIQKFDNWLIYFNNKEIIWNIYINEFEYIPSVTWIELDDIYKFEIEEINNSNWNLTTFSFTGWLTNATAEGMIKDILVKICNNENECNGSTNYNWSILNNFYYNRDWDQLNINIINNVHTINRLEVSIEDWLPLQKNHYKFQIEPIQKVIFP